VHRTAISPQCGRRSCAYRSAVWAQTTYYRLSFACPGPIPTPLALSTTFMIPDDAALFPVLERCWPAASIDRPRLVGRSAAIALRAAAMQPSRSGSADTAGAKVEAQDQHCGRDLTEFIFCNQITCRSGNYP